MTESAASEPIPAETLRTLAVAELTTIQNLLVYLDLDGLRSVRNRLHSPDLTRVCDEGPLAETRAVLLDTTCRVLVALGWAPEQYFLECGDMFPSVPDTIAGDSAVPLHGPASGAAADEGPEGGAWWHAGHAAPDDPTDLDSGPDDRWA
jgi:hypothetical protein